MSKKLGDLLLKEGVITNAQLEEALKCQVIFGGKLGTNLIEMGLVEENALARVLSRKLGVPCAEESELMRIPPEVIKLIPKDIAARYKVIPLRLENRRLTLVMADPTDLKAIDEIAFRTGFLVRPALTPEVRLILALEKYYDIERGIRYINAAKKSSASPAHRPAPPPPQRTPVKAAPSPARPTPARPTSGIQPPRRLAAEPGATPKAMPSPSRAPAAKPAPQVRPALRPAPQARAAQVSPVAGSLAQSLAAAEMPPDESPAEIVIPILEPIAEERLTLESVLRKLTEARDRDDIAEILAGYLGQEFPRGALFLVRGNAAMGWKAVTGARLIPGFEGLEIPLDEPSALKTVTDSKSFYLGPLARTPFNSMMLQAFGDGVPDTALLVPMLMMGRVVGILYVDGKNLNLGESLPDLQNLTTKASMAFEILVLKSKILSM